jgi:hypothetical protein
MQRYSSRRKGLDKDFINQKLKGAVSYDRIAGFFRSSILEVAGEALEKLEGTIRVVCNTKSCSQDPFILEKKEGGTKNAEKSFSSTSL